VTLDGQFLSLAVDVLIPPGFAMFVLLRRSKPFPVWAKALSIAGAVAGLAAAALGFLLRHYPQLNLTTDYRGLFLRFKFMLSGMFIGIAISIVVACMRTKPGEDRQRSV
jgi:hypothetical protein